MPKFGCRCGHVIDLSTIPCPDEWFVVKSSDWDKLETAILNDSGSPWKRSAQMAAHYQSLVECHECGRIWWFRKGFSQTPDEYVLVIEGDSTNSDEDILEE